MERSSGATPSASAPVSPTVEAYGFVFVSGQVGIDGSGDLVGQDIASQTRQAIANIESALREAGLELSDVLKATVYLVNRDDVRSMNEVYRVTVPEPFPARSTIVVADLPRPGARVEIEVVAARR